MPRPPGSPKTPGSGRKKGTPNKATAAIRKRIDSHDPIGQLFALADSTEDERIRLEALKAVLPYAYPKLSNVDMSVGGELTPVTIKVVPRGSGRAK
jgi:hypothetical protein